MNYKYLDKFPKPFLEDIINNRCIPIIGAGFSKNADLPKNKRMPVWDELGKNIADLIPDFKFNNALDALSAYEHEFSRTNLVEKLTDLLHVNSAKASKTHKAFCDLPFELTCTTNFEFLLEEGYTLVNKYCRPIIEEEQLAIANVKQGVSLFKLHGDLNHPKRLIVTEHDYDRFLNNYPLLSTFLANLLITKTPLFIGYSLDDTDFRQIWQLINDRLGNLRRQAYTIKVDCSQHEIARYERRRVKVINIKGNKSDYSKILEETFIELNDYWTKEILNYTTITEESTLAELSLPKGTNTRLCFFSIPLKILSFYKKFVFPIVENYGFVPVTADELISAGDNWTAKISAVIERAELIVVDLSSPNTLYELGLAYSKFKNKENILVIHDEDGIVPSDLKGLLTISRSKDPFEDIETLMERFEEWFTTKSDLFKQTYEGEPKRLYAKKEYRAAIISAITLLETALRERIEYVKESNLKRPYSLLKLLRMAADHQIIARNEYDMIKEWQYIRNQIVHTKQDTNFRQAKKVVDGVYEILKKI